jgi:hypothetical protein
MGTRSGLGLAERAEARKVMPQAKSLLPATATANNQTRPTCQPKCQAIIPPGTRDWSAIRAGKHGASCGAMATAFTFDPGW